MDFEDFIGEWVRWGISIVFVYFCYQNAKVRIIGYFIVCFLILAVTVRRFITFGFWGENETSDFVTALVIFGSCMLGHYRQKNKSL